MKYRVFKRTIQSMVIVAAAVTVFGCSGRTPELINDTYEVELGDEISTDAAEYLTFGDNISEEKQIELFQNVILDLSLVDKDTIGTYDASAVYRNKTYAFTVEVKDTTAPTAVLKSEVVKIPVDEELIASELVENIEDKQEVSIEFVGSPILADTVDGEKMTTEERNATCMFRNAGQYHVTVVLTDASGNSTELLQEVEAYIPDTIAPVISGVNDKAIYVGETIDYWKGVSALDDVDGDLTDKIEIDNEGVNTKKAGSYVVTYRVKDAAGNESVAEMRVTVKKQEIKQYQAVQLQTNMEESTPETQSSTGASSRSSGSHSDSSSVSIGQLEGDNNIATVAEVTAPSQSENTDTESSDTSSSDSAGTSTGTPVGVRTEHGTLLGGLPKE